MFHKIIPDICRGRHGHGEILSCGEILDVEILYIWRNFRRGEILYEDKFEMYRHLGCGDISFICHSCCFVAELVFWNICYFVAKTVLPRFMHFLCREKWSPKFFPWKKNDKYHVCTKFREKIFQLFFFFTYSVVFQNVFIVFSSLLVIEQFLQYLFYFQVFRIQIVSTILQRTNDHSNGQ